MEIVLGKGCKYLIKAWIWILNISLDAQILQNIPVLDNLSPRPREYNIYLKMRNFAYNSHYNEFNNIQIRQNNLFIWPQFDQIHCQFFTLLILSIFCLLLKTIKATKKSCWTRRYNFIAIYIIFKQLWPNHGFPTFCWRWLIKAITV